ncbi:MAG: DUF523 domain-containing protein [Clostridia bacterium]|nr:DUF523 domain-containing protein [Clostridia bacterium]
MTDRVIVSQCLLGVPCRYDGAALPHAEIIRAATDYCWIPVCPEILGGLSTPRDPAERVDNCVMTHSGIDVTKPFMRGAEYALRIAQLYGARFALLKERSPSCGCHGIYNGSFTGTLTDGMGITAELLMQNGIQVFGESQLQELLRKLRQ